jgi:glycosyltransferase involved in cell wall biosynthesis
MLARRLLVFSYYFPPDPSIGGARWAAMSEWLRRAGHEVTVITSRSNGSPDGVEPWVLRTFDVGAVGSVRRLLRRSHTPPSAVPATVHRPAPRWFTDVVVPDECLLTWVPAALARARRLLCEREIDCVITSGPPHSTHLLGLLLGNRRPAWIADLRDGWRFEALHPSWPTSAQDRLDALLERRTLRSAEAVVGVTPPIAEDAGARLGVLSAHVPNGWDPALDAELIGAARPTLDGNRVNVVYTGTLSGPRGRDPRPLFAAMRRLAAERPAVASRLRVVLAGRLNTDEQRLLARLDLGDTVEHVGSLSRVAAAALQRDADVLLLLSAPGHTSEATGKLFDYLAAGRPILALAQGNVAARTVRETGTGVAVAADDVDGIARALQEAVDGTLASAYAPRGLERYIYPGPAEEFAELIERAITQRTHEPHRPASSLTARLRVCPKTRQIASQRVWRADRGVFGRFLSTEVRNIYV